MDDDVSHDLVSRASCFSPPEDEVEMRIGFPPGNGQFGTWCLETELHRFIIFILGVRIRPR